MDEGSITCEEFKRIIRKKKGRTKEESEKAWDHYYECDMCCLLLWMKVVKNGDKRPPKKEPT